MTPTSTRARLRSWGDDADGNLYWRSRRWNGYVQPCDEGVTWLRGWFHDAKTISVLRVTAALS